MATEILTGQLIALVCGECQVDFAIPDWMYKARRADHHSFYCPHGHNRHYPAGKTETEKLREQVKDLEASRDFANQQRMAAQAEAVRLRKSAARAAKRSAAGVCPCCHRTIRQMAAHMKTKHPDYVAPSK